MNSTPAALVAAASAIFLGQSWKVIRPVFRGRKPYWAGAFQSGGMPSAHTAAVAAMALVTGLREGFSSSLFAVSLVLAAIVAHDAVKVRGTMNHIIRILRETTPPEVMEKGERLPDTVGHSLREVIAGLFLAFFVAGLVHWLLPT